MRFSIRPLATHADYDACVALQRETWGRDFADVVPPSILEVTRRIGGVVAGAFTDDGQLAGFVFGMTGWEAGRPVHWSDMLAVRPQARNLGVGRALKEYQRRMLRARGVEVVYWTYDPLVARNAHLNLDVFGVRVVEYVVDMYGDSASDLHRGIGTDRFVVAWDIGGTRDGGAARDAGRVARGDEGQPAPSAARGGTRDESERRIEIPLDINALQQSDPARAAEWRAITRPAFVDALAAGWVVVGFEVDRAAERGYYLLARGAPETAARQSSAGTSHDARSAAPPRGEAPRARER